MKGRRRGGRRRQQPAGRLPSPFGIGLNALRARADAQQVSGFSRSRCAPTMDVGQRCDRVLIAFYVETQFVATQYALLGRYLPASFAAVVVSVGGEGFLWELAETGRRRRGGDVINNRGVVRTRLALACFVRADRDLRHDTSRAPPPQPLAPHPRPFHIRVTRPTLS
ncbi:hypothetical protein EVAR_80485_1 [Eumeta japonica]|uniref:Uncharacterized protein n=1 Tax=Eumeta variegata TaxID=151549 RepID=A0A4C1ZH09_EUMVA|nr:hypothetical protein EVAR_80485_1 [Eumeta japonica]